MAEFDFNSIVTGLLVPVVLLLVKILLDFSLAQVIVKNFYWIPVRSLFRDRPINISGVWEQTWGAAGSEDFKLDIDRHSYTEIKQFGRYCYAEFYSKGVAYCIFAKIENNYLTGNWYEKQDRFSYFGAFQLRIIDGKSMEGKFIGHSKKTFLVQHDDWVWRLNG